MPSEQTSARTDIAVATILVVAALLCLFWVIPNNTEPPLSENDISPAFFPILSASLVLVLGVGLIATRLKDISSVTVGVAGSKVALELGIWAIAAIAIWMAMPVIGFVPTAILIVLLGAVTVRYRHWLIVVPFALVFAFAVDFGAWQIFTVDLP